MLNALDSAYAPSPAQIAAAKAAGYDAWFGYFAGPNILNGWTDAQFQAVINGGMDSGAYCSGWADAASMKTHADALNAYAASRGRGFVGMLDDESGIRSLPRLFPSELSSNRFIARAMMHGGGPRPVLELVNGIWTVSAWVQPWLNTSGFGQYGNMPVFAGVSASRYVFAAYPGGDPGLSWPSYYARPADGHPCGWQFQGTHVFDGIGVDSTHLDDGFFGLHGGGGGNVQGDDMFYTGPVHAFSGSLKAFTPGSYYWDPCAQKPAGGVTTNAVYPVDGYVFSSAPVQSPNLGNGQPGPDYVMWHIKNGGWIPDAILNTIGVAGAPAPSWPSTEPVAQLYDPATNRVIPLPSGGGGLTMVQVDSEIAAKLAAYTPPAGLTMAQVDQEIASKLAGLPAPVTLEDVKAAVSAALATLRIVTS